MEIGSRWQRISQSQKEHYKKLAEEQQKQYRVHLDLWVKVRGQRTHGREREAPCGLIISFNSPGSPVGQCLLSTYCKPKLREVK